MRRIAVYLRVSTENQTMDLQRSEIDQYIQSKGWSYVVYYEDKVSGTTNKRPGLQNMLSDARKGSFDVLICWKLDRLFRSLKDLITTLNELAELKIDFISIKDNIDMTTASGRLLAHLLGAIAQFEADIIKMRVLAGLKEARRKGIKLGRPTTLQHEDIAILRAQGLSLGEISKRLKVSKSAVHKSLSRKPVQKRSINIENTVISKSVLSGHQTTVLCPMVECHESGKKCHEVEISVAEDTKDKANHE